ncbi:MAG: Mg chelatase-like protein [Frankiales bacterium]|nr:Mg chelatase-like protein [Frankiales bacterium]
MALGTSWSVALVGLEGHVVRVEADLAPGIPGLTVTGLPDASLSEAKDRIKAAIHNSGGAWPGGKRITIGLSPASLPKRGSGFDIALAAAVLSAVDDNPAFPPEALAGTVLLGELGLNGSVRRVTGVLPALLSVRDRFDRAIVPVANLAEARLVPGLEVQGVRSLWDLVQLLRGEPREEVTVSPVECPGPPDVGDYVDVAGQPTGRDACELVAAGGHSLLMTGPPGCGKTLLAERLPSILPPLSMQESLEVTAIHSIADSLPAETLVSRPPFQAPHHSSTAASLIGGGSGVARPGAVSLAHRGVLFLDEAPEFTAHVLDCLRQPLEKSEVVLQRVLGTATYPCRFTLVMAANPCPCAQPDSRCTCPPERRRTYLQRLSGPLLDRVDVNVRMGPISKADVLLDSSNESSAALAARVESAREAAGLRYVGTAWRTNCDVPPLELQARWPLSRAARAPLMAAMDNGQLTARGYGRVQRMAWTVADLEGHISPSRDDVGKALFMRLGDVAGAWVA